VENPQNWYKRLAADPRVAAYSPQLTANVIFSKGKATASAALVGCDPVQQVKVTTIGEYVIEGKWTDLAAGGNRIAIGDELRKKLGVYVSQNILVSSAKSPPTPFKVVAVFRTGSMQADTRAYGAVTDVQRVNRTPNQVNEIAVRLHDYTQAAALATNWSAISPEKVESWDQQNASLFSVFALQDAIRFLSIGAIMIVAGFGIYNVLNMTVVQKRRDIAILRSMGYSGADVVWLFFSQGLILGLSGVALGLSFGYGLCLYLETIPFGAGPMGRGAGHLIISFDAAIYLQSALLAMLAALLASVLPARAAGKLAPIEIIRAGAE
jgi:lipoprotein-releasing system permease protein